MTGLKAKSSKQFMSFGFIDNVVLKLKSETLSEVIRIFGVSAIWISLNSILA